MWISGAYILAEANPAPTVHDIPEDLLGIALAERTMEAQDPYEYAAELQLRMALLREAGLLPVMPAEEQADEG
jgi:hypothetical protein